MAPHPPTGRQRQSRHVESRQMLASDSFSRTSLLPQQATEATQTQQQNLPSASWLETKSTTCSNTLQALRTILLLALLLPYVSALPSSIRAPERSEGLVGTPISDLSQSSPLLSNGQVEERFSFSSRRSNLDRNGASTSKLEQRDVVLAGEPNDVFPAVAPVNTTSNATDGRTLTIVFSPNTTSTTTTPPPGRRWGQTSTYLPGHNILLTVGGQTSLSGAVTNDVYALNLTSNTWQRLSSEGLPAHAFAAATGAVDPVTGQEELWVVGGVTENCACDAPAYVWSTQGDVSEGKWRAVYSDTGASPSRRKGAKAIVVDGKVMVMGGEFDSSTCASSNGTYGGVDMWSPSPSQPLSTPETALVGIDTSATSFASIQSLALPSMPDLSLTDYTTVTLPPTANCSSKILFLGGKDFSNTLVPLSHFWALDTQTLNFELWNSTGLIPSPRLGHTAVVTADGKVVIHGGYLQDPQLFAEDNDPVGEVFILDPRQKPARWNAAVWTNESTSPPALAFHSSAMVGEVMVTSFGKGGDAVESAGRSFVENAGSAGPVHYLDTSTLASAGGLTWSTSTEGVAQARQALAGTFGAPVPVQVVQSTPAAPQPATAQAAPTVASPATATAEPAAPTQTPTEDTEPKTAIPSTPEPASVTSSPPNHTGAIAGSLLGAAALAAALGGLYAYRKRKEAAAFNAGLQASSSDLAYMGDEEKGPPVSTLFLQPSRSAGAGWGARLKRTLTKSSAGSGAATIGEPVATLSNTAPQGELPSDFINTLLNDDEPLGRGELLHPSSYDEVKLNSRLSSATLDTDAGVSHFSYPYLTSPGRTRVVVGTPESAYDLHMSPGDVLSPYHLPRNPRSSPESVFLEDEEDTTVGMQGGSEVVQTPMFPWATPVIAEPPKAARAVSLLRSKPSTFRVVNAS